jgi:hypothetical protein
MAVVDISATMLAPCSSSVLFAEVEDLTSYPAWLTIVPRAEATEPRDTDEGPAWLVELRGRIGPLARSKRLRMVRTVHEPGRRVRFERRELDGREHSAWVLEASVHADGDEASTLEMALHYGGSFGGSMLEKLLNDEIEVSRSRLAERVSVASGHGRPMDD